VHFIDEGTKSLTNTKSSAEIYSAEYKSSSSANFILNSVKHDSLVQDVQKGIKNCRSQPKEVNGAVLNCSERLGDDDSKTKISNKTVL
jgi:hypothetical protein